MNIKKYSGILLLLLAVALAFAAGFLVNQNNVRMLKLELGLRDAQIRELIGAIDEKQQALDSIQNIITRSNNLLTSVQQELDSTRQELDSTTSRIKELEAKPAAAPAQ